MTYVWVKWLADALRAEGCRVSEQSGWTTRGRPSSTGSFNPSGVLWHHTATHSSSSDPHPTLHMCINGRPDLSGPLCHALIGYDGVAYVIAAGRANHAGQARASGPMPSGDGNALYIGFEIDYDGSQKMSTAQYDCSIRAAAAVCRRFGRSSSYARGHKETSTTGKWDPGGYSLDGMRSDVAGRLTGQPDTPAEDEEEDPMFLMVSDGAGPSGTIYVCPPDLRYKVPLDKPSYDALIKVQKTYARVDISAAQLESIPLVQTAAVYVSSDDDPAKAIYLAPPDLTCKIHVTDGASKNALDATKVTGKGRYDEVKVSKAMLDNIPTVGHVPG